MKGRKAILAFPLLLSVFSLCSCQENPFGQDTQAATNSFTSKIFPNGIWDFVIQLIAFVILLLIVFFLAYKPVKKMLRKRKEEFTKMVEDTEANQAIARHAAENADLVIEEGKQEAGAIIAEARKQAEEEKQAILKQAEEEALQMRKRAEVEIEEAKEASKAEMREQIIDVAMLASEKVLGREVDHQDNDRLVADFLDSMNAGEEE